MLPDLPLPTGRYAGRVTAAPWWLRPVGWVWQGKVFDGATVRNRIGPWLLVPGQVTSDPGTVQIRYPGGLTDYLTPRAQGVYAGVLPLGRWMVRFELTPVPDQQAARTP